MTYSSNIPSGDWMQWAKDINRKWKRKYSIRCNSVESTCVCVCACVSHGFNRVIKVVADFRNGERIILFNVLAPYFLHVFPLSQMGKMHPKYNTIGKKKERYSHGRTVANNNFTIEFIQNGRMVLLSTRSNWIKIVGVCLCMTHALHWIGNWCVSRIMRAVLYGSSNKVGKEPNVFLLLLFCFLSDACVSEQIFVCVCIRGRSFVWLHIQHSINISTRCTYATDWNYFSFFFVHVLIHMHQ